MTALVWLLALSTLVTVTVKGVKYQRATVCRQEAWRTSTELLTRRLLTSPPPRERASHLGCRLHFLRSAELVTWQGLSSLKRHIFQLSIRGSL